MAGPLPDQFAAVIWIGVNLILFRCAWQVSRRMFPSDGFLQQLIHVVVLFWAGVVGTAIILGALGLLSRPNLFTAVALAAGLLLAIDRWKPEKRPWAQRIQSTSMFDTSSAGIVRLRSLFCAPREDLQFSGRVRAEHLWLGMWGICLAFGLSILVFDGILCFPTDWDSLTYHIPLMHQWLHQRSLYAPDCGCWYNPGNNELLGLWITALFSGDFLVSLNNLPAILLLGAGAVELGTGIGLDRPLCHLAGLVVVSTSPVLLQLVDSENDVAVGGLYLVSLGYVIRSLRHSGHSDQLWAAISLGLLCGVKYYALGYAAIAWCACVLLTLAVRGIRTAAQAAVIGAGGILVWGGYWYLRNAILTGTPLYPKGFTSATDLWSVMRPNSWTSTLLGNGRSEIWELALLCVRDTATPCHLTAVLALPVVVAWLAFSGYRMTRRADLAGEGTVRLGFASILVATGLVLLTTPNLVEMVPGTLDMLHRQYLPARFGLCFLSLSVLAFTVLLQDVSRGMSRMLCCISDQMQAHLRSYPKLVLVRSLSPSPTRALALCIHTTVFIAIAYQMARLLQLYSPPSLMERVLVALGIWTAGVLTVLVWTARPRLHGTIIVALPLILATAFVWSCGRLAMRWHLDFIPHYDEFFNSACLTGLAGLDSSATRICVCDYRYYPFLGSSKQFAACRPFWVPTSSALMQYLRNQHVTVVVARNRDPCPQQLYVGVCDWLLLHPDVFVCRYSDNLFSVFSVDRDRLERMPYSQEGFSVPCGRLATEVRRGGASFRGSTEGSP